MGPALFVFKKVVSSPYVLDCCLKLAETLFAEGTKAWMRKQSDAY